MVIRGTCQGPDCGQKLAENVDVIVNNTSLVHFIPQNIEDHYNWSGALFYSCCSKTQINVEIRDERSIIYMVIEKCILTRSSPIVWPTPEKQAYQSKTTKSIARRFGDYIKPVTSGY